MPIPTRRPAWDVATALVVVAVAAAHAIFLAVDPRVPRDLGQYYQSLPRIYRALSDPGPELLSLLTDRGGWYNGLLAGWLHLFGRTGDALQSVDVIGVAIIVALAAVAARAVAQEQPSRAGFMAACVAGAAPIVMIQGRASWIHIPEAALVLGALVAHLLDPALERRRTIVVSGLCGLLAIALRPSGLVWMASLAPLLLAVPASSRRRAAATVSVWALGVLPLLSGLQMYMGAKMTARGRYAEQVPELLVQIQSGLGIPLLVFGLVGVAFALRRRRGPAEVVLVTWLFLPFLLWGLFRAGIDNFTPVAPALAVLAGLGYAGRALPVGLAAALWVGYFAPQFVWPRDNGALVHFSRAVGLPVAPEQGSLYRPFSDWAYEVVPTLIEATCPAPEPCVIAVDQGLFEPYGEDPGFLRLFLGGYDHVHLAPIAMPAPEDPPIDALVRYECGAEHEQRWRDRYPHSKGRALDLIRRFRLERAWSGDAYPGCTVVWLTPDGRLAREDLAPRDIPTADDAIRGGGAPLHPEAPPGGRGSPPPAGPHGYGAHQPGPGTPGPRGL